jgi:hypothetical protein
MASAAANGSAAAILWQRGMARGTIDRARLVQRQVLLARRQFARPGHRTLAQKLCYSETVKNLTVSVPDGVYRNARVAAARRDTSVSALVVAFLEQLSGRMDEFARLEDQQRQVLDEITQFRAADRLGRNEVHERAVR